MTNDYVGLSHEPGFGGSMQRGGKRTYNGAGLNLSDDELDVLRLGPLSGGEPRSGQLTGTRALMLAVLEDGIRSYLGNSRIISQDAEHWIFSPRRHSPFSFIVVCEVLGLDPDAVRKTLRVMKSAQVPPRKAIPRARHNVRIPGRVYARRR